MPLPHNELEALPEELRARRPRRHGRLRLKRVRRVSEKMERLVKNKKLDAKLFRQKPLSRKLTEKDKIELHPFSNAVHCTAVGWTRDRQGNEKLAAPIFCDIENANGFDYAAVDEFATCPACKSVQLNLRIGVVLVRSGTGVTMRDVLTEMAIFWWRPKHNREDRNGWTGIAKVKVQKSVSVYLKADRYDF
ncbi:hypothetical protein JCM8547_007507 [Rhodosporidiobolus lusitaniae]